MTAARAPASAARRCALATLAALALLLAGCMTVEVGGETGKSVHLALHDAATGGAGKRPAPVVDALLIQPRPGDAVADTTGIAYSARAQELAFYQWASWTERPVRQVPRLLQRRLQARGVAAAVGQLGDPMNADWLLAVGIDAVQHDVLSPPGQARLALTVDLFDRRTRTRVAQRHFEATVPSARADSAAAAEAMSQALAKVFDALVPWLEGELERAAARPR